MPSSNSADQSKPFVLSTTLGEFLRGTSNFFLTIALMFSFMEYFEMKVETNNVVFTMLLNAVVINVLLEINSKLLYAIVGFLTFLSVIAQLVVSFMLLLASNKLKSHGISQTAFIITLICIVLFVSVVLILQLFCSAALFKLSGVMDLPEPVKKVEPKRKSKKGKKTVESVESARNSSQSSSSPSCTCSSSEPR